MLSSVNGFDGLVGQDGERHSFVYRPGRSFQVIIDDFREDPLYVDPQQSAEWQALEEASTLDLKEVARVALDTMSDVSCAAISAALGLKLHTVIGMSNGRHNKATKRGVSRGIELAEVTREELIENYRNNH